MRFFRLFLILLCISLLLLGGFYGEERSVSSLEVHSFPVTPQCQKYYGLPDGTPVARLSFHSYGSSFIIRGVAQSSTLSSVSKNISIHYTIHLFKMSLKNNTYISTYSTIINGSGKEFCIPMNTGPGSYRMNIAATLNVGNLTTSQIQKVQENFPSSSGLIRVVASSDSVLLLYGEIFLICAFLLFFIANIRIIFKHRRIN